MDSPYAKYDAKTNDQLTSYLIRMSLAPHAMSSIISSNYSYYFLEGRIPIRVRGLLSPRAYEGSKASTIDVQGYMD